MRTPTALPKKCHQITRTILNEHLCVSRRRPKKKNVLKEDQQIKQSVLFEFKFFPREFRSWV